MKWLFIFSLFLGICLVSANFALPSEHDDVDEEEERLVNELESLVTTGQKSRTLANLPKIGPFLRDSLRSKLNKVKNVGICTVCRAAARVLLGLHKLGATRDEFAHAANVICVNARIESERVCKGVIDLNIDTFIYIFDHRPDLSPMKMCSIIAQPFECKENLFATHFGKKEWSINIKPLPKKYPQLQQGAKDSLRILHFTDVHFDDIYEVGSNAKCGEPLCCGSNQGKPNKSSDAAGYWGDYRYCDTPWHAVEDIMQQMNKEKYDYVYYTGDTINHRVWETTVASNEASIKKVNKIIRDTFLGTPVYPILGNHEPSPLDLFAPVNITEPGLTTQWLLDTAAEDWAPWLPISTAESIKKGGYYTVLVKPGWRIIALNSNIGYVWNWWLLYNDVDPYGQLQWLHDTLAQAEENQEIVHILSHVPPGDNTCHKPWANNYNKIIERFSHIIAVQFNGHSHYNEFNVFYFNKKAESVAYNAGSVTTYYYMNPMYRVYDVNSTNYRVMDYEDWTFNLTLANQAPNVAPTWYKLYNFKDAWNVQDMTNFDQVNQVVKDIATSKNKFDQYFRFKVREGDPYMAEGCDVACQEENICRIVTTEFGKDEMCEEIINNSFLKPYKHF